LSLVQQLTEELGRLYGLAEARAALLDLFGLFGITPDVGVGQPLFQFVEFPSFGLDIKETSAATPLCRRVFLLAGIILEDRAWPRRFLRLSMGAR
jgi:hypothetical protein